MKHSGDSLWILGIKCETSEMLKMLVNINIGSSLLYMNRMQVSQASVVMPTADHLEITKPSPTH